MRVSYRIIAAYNDPKKSSERLNILIEISNLDFQILIHHPEEVRYFKESGLRCYLGRVTSVREMYERRVKHTS